MPARPTHWEPCGKFKVYFPKFVTINNPRLGILYWVVMIITVGIAVYQFVADKRSEIEKLPIGDAQVCGALCQKTQTQFNTDMATCPDEGYKYNPYNPIGCMKGCASAGSSGPCITAGEANQVEATGVFIPTFVQENTYDGTGWFKQYFFVPGVEDQSITFEHGFSVPKPRSSIFGESPDETGDSDDDMETIVLKGDGGEMARFKGGETITFKVKELLESGWIDDIGEKDNQRSLSLDEEYSFEPEGVTGNPRLRLTGMTIVFDIFYTNAGGCQLSMKHDWVTTDNKKLGCVIPKISRKWTRKSSTSLISANGDAVSRIYHGIQFEFHVEGSFKFLDAAKVFKGLTTILIWMQIPIWVLYFFSIIFLGQLSAIYNRVIHQEMSLKDAIVGLAARLISHSSAYADVQDQADGISKQRILERFSLIMQYNEDLDDAEVAKFVDFVYKALASAGGIEVGQTAATSADAISVQDFCAACSSNEPLTFDALVQIFDQNRELPFFEGIFNDAVCARVRNVASQKDMMESLQQGMFKHGGNRLSMTTSKHVLDLPNRYEEINRKTSETEIECNKLLSKYDKLLGYVREAEKELKKVNPSALT
mmetsp:Transcript_27011/g.46879  ORF Transcript_27011/g.46879 Transcript_27011/m.46879 type:complete len:595 (-) Transcript_27011:201-1985(-)